LRGTDHEPWQAAADQGTETFYRTTQQPASETRGRRTSTSGANCDPATEGFQIGVSPGPCQEGNGMLKNRLNVEERMIVKTYCARMDHGGCALLAHVEDGKILKIEGDPDSPFSRGQVCAKGLAQLERINHPDRLLYPLKRKGERGENKWDRVSWDEALDTIVDKLRDTLSRDGQRAVAFAQGTPKGPELFLMRRLANLLKVPNVSTPGNICHMPRETASTVSCGFYPVADYDNPPACVVLWGSNLFQTNEEGVLASQLKHALDQQAKLMVIDPRRTSLASRADLWLRPRPGTDLALALGWLKILVDEGLYDKGFVEKWTLGFPQLVDHLRQYSLKKISEITWIPEAHILQAARLFAQAGPACIQWGNALEHNRNSFQCARALLILMAVSGNLEVPGGNVNRPGPSILKPGPLVQSNKFPDRKEEILSPEFRLAAMLGFVPSQILTRAILSGKPYPVRWLYILGGNPLLSYANSQETFNALKKLSFLAISEIFMTPTAQLADLVLPAAAHFEFDDIGHYALPHGFILARPKIVEPPGECWPDSRVLNELGRRLGFEEYFWKEPGEWLDDILKPAGMNYEEFKKLGILKGQWEYRTFEKNGFQTPSGKFEIYSQKLRDWGYDPLPVFHELPESPVSTPEIFKEYPLIFTSAKDPFYFHSSGRNLPSLRKLSPAPLISIHPETAARSGIREGDWVSVETKRGKIRQQARLDPAIDPRVVVLSFGWWFPEREDLELSGWRESNINILTDNGPPYDEAVGSTALRGALCRISKARGI
jgi:anaerobic selenocysteine-containing dehydrogenase